jgi:hypothetical protein
MNNLYDFVSTMADQRIPPFSGAGIRREGGQVHFGRGRGMFFLCQTLYVRKHQGKIVITNSATNKGDL